MKIRGWSISWSYIVAYGLSIVLMTLIAIRLVQYFSSTRKVTEISFALAEKDLDIVFGKDSADINIIMYSSYGCSFCQRFFVEVYPLIKSDYIDNGKVKLSVRLIAKSRNPDLINSIKTAHCISKYGNFEKMHELLLTNHRVVYSQEFREMIYEFAEKDIFVGECIWGSEADEYLKINEEDFEKLNLKGTPAFIINNHIYRGYKDYNQLTDIIKTHINP
jgi:hypothetical protein